MEKVLSFIELIRESCPELQTKIFTEGACYQFHLILKHRFPEAIPYYDSDHVVTKIGNSYYDINGEVDGKSHCKMHYVPDGWGYRYPIDNS